MNHEVISNSFRPATGRGSIIDERMRHELAYSLSYIKKQIQTQVTDKRILDLLPDLEAVIITLRQGKKITPAVFGYYYQLVFEIINGVNLNYISRKIKQLSEAAEYTTSIVVKSLSVSELGSEEKVILYRQCLDTDDDEKFGFLEPSLENSCLIRSSVYSTLDLMKQTVPELYDEVSEIISEILLASAPDTKNAPDFDGASSYMLWGVVVLNADNNRSDIEMLEILAHECAHCLLFGLTIDEPLVLNDCNERYKSPVRHDLRPMDGIYHATFVSARMHYALVEAVKSGFLSEAQRKECKAHMAASRKAFYDGYAVVSAHARYSDTGSEIMQNAYEYMQEVAPVVAVSQGHI